MSFIIKGIDAPKDCMSCPCRKDVELDYRGNMIESYCSAIEGYPDIPETVNYHLDDCPLVALPKKHGRLIDADALPLKDIDNANYPSNYIRLAPTIIEAEE